jgi:hypothetical protein
MTLQARTLAPETLAANLRQERERALQQEKESWAKVKGRYPGQNGHDPDEWRKWQAFANRVQALSEQLHAAEPKAAVRNWRGS